MPSGLPALLSAIVKKYGNESVMVGHKVLSVPVIPTGSLMLDLALGVGGLPRGRIVEVFGPFSSGKTSLCQHVVAECQRMGGTAAFIDVEHALDSQWAQTCGVDLDKLVISQPNYGEEALDIALMMARSGEVDVIVLDSVAALAPKAEIEGEIGDAHMAMTARLMSQTMRQMYAAVNQSQCVMIFINQLRMKIGVMFGPNETTTGGEALKYAASVRLDMRQKQAIKDKEEVIGHIVKVSVRKNKVASPYVDLELEIYRDEGVSRITDLLNLGVLYGVIVRAGAWYEVKEQKFQGLANLRQALKDDSELTMKLEDDIRIRVGLPLRRTV